MSLSFGSVIWWHQLLASLPGVKVTWFAGDRINVSIGMGPWIAIEFVDGRGTVLSGNETGEVLGDQDPATAIVRRARAIIDGAARSEPWRLRA